MSTQWTDSKRQQHNDHKGSEKLQDWHKMACDHSHTQLYKSAGLQREVMTKSKQELQRHWKQTALKDERPQQTHKLIIQSCRVPKQPQKTSACQSHTDLHRHGCIMRKRPSDPSLYHMHTSACSSTSDPTFGKPSTPSCYLSAIEAAKMVGHRIRSQNLKRPSRLRCYCRNSTSWTYHIQTFSPDKSVHLFLLSFLFK